MSQRAKNIISSASANQDGLTHRTAPLPHALGEYIKKHREAKGYSLRELSGHVGTHPSFLTRVEQGLYAQPAPEILRRVATALDVPPEDVFALAGYEVPENLPTFPAYLRTKYEMSSAAAAQLNDYFNFLAERHGIREKDTPKDRAAAKAAEEAKAEPFPDVESPDFDPRFLKHPSVAVPNIRASASNTANEV